MVDNTPKEVERLVREAKDEERSAKKAEDVLDDAISHMTPQRQYDKERSLRRR